eukprot:6615358-Pyramimonas_sp.AAC.1
MEVGSAARRADHGCAHDRCRCVVRIGHDTTTTSTLILETSRSPHPILHSPPSPPPSASSVDFTKTPRDRSSPHA